MIYFGTHEACLVRKSNNKTVMRTTKRIGLSTPCMPRNCLTLPSMWAARLGEGGSSTTISSRRIRMRRWAAAAVAVIAANAAYCDHFFFLWQQLVWWRCFYFFIYFLDLPLFSWIGRGSAICLFAVVSSCRGKCRYTKVSWPFVLFGEQETSCRTGRGYIFLFSVQWPYIMCVEPVDLHSE